MRTKILTGILIGSLYLVKVVPVPDVNNNRHENLASVFNFYKFVQKTSKDESKSSKKPFFLIDTFYENLDDNVNRYEKFGDYEIISKKSESEISFYRSIDDIDYVIRLKINDEITLRPSKKTIGGVFYEAYNDKTRKMIDYGYYSSELDSIVSRVGNNIPKDRFLDICKEYSFDFMDTKFDFEIKQNEGKLEFLVK